MFIRAFAFYLSSMTLVSLSLDRCLAIAKPMASLQQTGKIGIKRRGQIMITSAWLISALCALPQTLVFRVLKHPEMDFYQCTTMDYFNNIFNNATILTPMQAEKIYSSLFLVVVYVVPLLVIIVTYANIILKVFRKTKGDNRPIVVSRVIKKGCDIYRCCSYKFSLFKGYRKRNICQNYPVLTYFSDLFI